MNRMNDVMDGSVFGFVEMCVRFSLPASFMQDYIELACSIIASFWTIIESI